MLALKTSTVNVSIKNILKVILFYSEMFKAKILNLKVFRIKSICTK